MENSDSGKRFSFKHSAETLNNSNDPDKNVLVLENVIEEVSVRLPRDDKEHALYEVEKRAHEVLGLEPELPFLVIVRVRLIKGVPSALHVVYLDPRKFPGEFNDTYTELEQESLFSKDKLKHGSLIDIYEQYKYEMASRDTMLSARWPTIYEQSIFRKYPFKEYPSVNLTTGAVLDAEQQLYAKDPKTGETFVLEYLKASYFNNWKYNIKNRPA